MTAPAPDARRHRNGAVDLGRLGGDSARYLVVSAIALGCDIAVYTILIGSGHLAPVAGALGYAVGLLAHFTLSSYWVFPDADQSRRLMPTFAKFVATGMFGLALTAAIIGVLTRSGLADPFTAKGAAVAATYVAVFVLRRAYVFATHPRH